MTASDSRAVGALVFVASAWLGLASCFGQSTALPIAEALDDPGGVWTGAITTNPLAYGWMGLADSTAHDGVDAVRFSRYSGNFYLLQRDLPGAGTASFWWRRTGESYRDHPVECLLAGVPVRSLLYPGAWQKIHLAISSAAPITFRENARYQLTWIDEFSFVPATGPGIDEILDSPGLRIFAASENQPWHQAPDASPNAPANGCLRLPANVLGELKLTLPAPGTLRYWTRHETPGTQWLQTTVSISTTPTVLTLVPYPGYPQFVSPFAFSVDGISWVPATPVSLAEALDTSLEVMGGGWEGVRDELLSADGVDAAIARTNYGVLTTTVTGPARVRFQGRDGSNLYGTTLDFSVDSHLANRVSGGYQLQEVLIRESGPHSLRWSGPAGSAVDSLTVEALPEIVSTTLNEALDTNDFTFTQDETGGWEGRATPDASDGEDAAFSPFLVPWPLGPQPWLTAQFSTTQTARVSFEAKLDQPHTATYLVEVDGLQTGLEATGAEWSRRELIVGPGSHVIRWLAIAGSSYHPPHITYRRLLLDKLALTPTGGIAPAEALDYPAGIIALDQGEQLTVDTVITHDGADALRLTLPGGSIHYRLGPGTDPAKTYLHLWVRTDAPAGAVAINDVIIGSGEWIPLVVYGGNLSIQGPAGAQVWIDELVPVAWMPVGSGVGDPEPAVGDALDTAAVTFREAFLHSFTGVVAHDGEDVLAAGQTTGDDNNILEIRFDVAGEASATFWWRSQRQLTSSGEIYDDPAAWVTVDGRLAAILAVGVSGPWRKAAVPVPAGAHEVRIFMNHSNATTLFLDEFALEPFDPLATYDGFAAASGLRGWSAAPGFDADGDGWANFAEFALGTDPASAASQPGARFSIVARQENPGDDESPVSVRVELRGIHPVALFNTALSLQATGDLSGDSWSDLAPLRASDYSLEADGTLTLSLAIQPVGQEFFRARFHYEP